MFSRWLGYFLVVCYGSSSSGIMLDMVFSVGESGRLVSSGLFMGNSYELVVELRAECRVCMVVINGGFFKNFLIKTKTFFLV